MAKTPKLPNIRWRNGWAYGRIERSGREHSIPLETQDPREAQVRVGKWLKELAGTNWGEKPRPTFDEAASRYIDEHLPRLKPRTSHRYLQSLQHLTGTFEGKRLDEIGSGLLSEFESKRRAAGVTSGTIRHDLFVLSSILTCANEWEWIDGNKAAAYLRSRKKRGLLVEQPPRHRYASHEEERELYRRAEQAFKDGREHHSVMLRAAMALTIDIGLRSNELLQAEWPMVDLDANEWHVPREMDKSGLGRTIPILERSQRILKALPRSRTCSFVIWHPPRWPKPGRGDERYFDLLPFLNEIATGGRSKWIKHQLTSTGRRKLELTEARRDEMARNAEARAWAPVIEDLIWHDLRRTCGCRLLQDYRMPIEKVSKWLGHQSIEITQKAYAFLEVRHLHSAAQASEADQRRLSAFVEGVSEPSEPRANPGHRKLIA